MKKYIYFLLLSFLITACSSSSNPIKNRQLAAEWSKNAVIYEINVRQFSNQGTFNAVTSELSRLQNLGVNVLWLMPIQPLGVKNRKGGVGSHYSIKNYSQVNPNYGTLADFKLLVTTAHQKGMKVIIDWVANHTSWDNNWINSNPDFYAKNDSGKMYSPYDWSDVAQLNFNNTTLQDSMINAMKYWLTETDIDGFRCDVAFLVPPTFWNKARTQLDNIKPIFMLAEMETQKDKHPNPKTYYHTAFDACYAWNMHGTLAEIFANKKKPSAWYASLKAHSDLSDTTYRMMFTSNHDENTWNGTDFEKFGSNMQLASLLTFTMPGSFPLIYNGQETQNKKRLAFFEKDPIVWNDTSLYSWYRTLNHLKHTEPAIWNGIHGAPAISLLKNPDADSAIYAFVRTKGNSSIATIVNLSAKPIQIPKFENIDLNNYQSLFNKSLQFNNGYTIPAFGWYIYKLKK